MNLLSIKQVSERAALSVSQIYALISEQKFPQGHKLRDCRATRWKSTTVDQWIADQIGEGQEAA